MGLRGKGKSSMPVLEKDEKAIAESAEVSGESAQVVKTKTRDVSIDLIRVVACLIVILTHLCLQVLNQCYNRIDWSRLLEKSFFTDGVPIFFMITGFFIVNGRSYKKIWKTAIKKVLIPSLLFVLLTEWLYLYIVNKDTIWNCIENPSINWAGILQAIFKGDVTYINTTCAHLWYIFSYVKVLIWIPILWLICKPTKESNFARRIIMGFSIASLTLTDIQRFVTLPIVGEFNILTFIPKEILYVLLGYELFAHKDKIKKNNKIAIISFIGFIAINLLRYKIEMQYMVLNSLTDIIGRPSFTDWRHTVLNVFSAMFIFMFLYSFEIKSERLSKFIISLSNKTFGIYLIHYIVIAKIDLYKFEKIEKFIYEIAYLAIGLVVILIISIAIVWAIKVLKDNLVMLIEYIYKKLRGIKEKEA